MKRKIYLLLILALTINCSSNNETTIDETNENEVSKPVLNITNFTAKINSPSQKRDYSYHKQGYEGIFEKPEDLKVFNGSINISYGNNSAELKNTDIQLIWRSNIDGILFQGNPDEAFESEVEKKLTKGVHTVFFEASIPSENINIKDSIILSNNIKLKTLSTGTSVKLDWTKYEGSDFVSYKIYGEGFIPITEINDINKLEYEVTNFDSLVEKKVYQVIVETNENYDHVIGSNIESMHPGIFIDFPYYISKIIKDPSREKLYALVGNKSYESDVYGLLIIDVNDQTFKINTHILKDDIFADLDISPDGEHLFLCQERVDKLTKVNLNTLEAKTFPTHTSGWGIHKIEVGNNNLLYCHRDPPTSGSTTFWIYNGNNGDLVRAQTGGLSHGDIEFNSTNNTLYAGESNTSNGRMYKMSVSGNSINLDTNYPIWPNGVSHPYPFILLSNDNQSIFWENYQLDLDLNVIRTFNTAIKACSTKNNYLADYEKIYNYSDLSIAYEFKGIPEGTFILNSVTFSDDKTLIYSRANQSNVKYATDPYYKAQTYLFKFEID
ncbi:hypothetical protein [uncultured Tenacibaculum sp.]|uniref:hypothetical protein n=1 Tax=uncultured Tenacibaculum sp. TaxID=174713 RepID=UPI0026108EBB|nr:hypothetical protein [uncultured Tenacibaculum sp.]